jgi:putative transposase
MPIAERCCNLKIKNKDFGCRRFNQQFNEGQKRPSFGSWNSFTNNYIRLTWLLRKMKGSFDWMGQSRVLIYVHLTWTTKYRYPLLEDPRLKPQLGNFIREYAIEKGINVIAFNFYKDHCHCLVRLHAIQNIAFIMQLLKGASSSWIRKNQFVEYFAWQDGYSAESIRYTELKKVIRYIINQEAHHTALK